MHPEISADGLWRGSLYFDGPRNEYPTATVDWARINEMPQWFVVRPEKQYQVVIDANPATAVPGQRLLDGLAIQVTPGHPRRIVVQAAE